jgi:hypothetical protein
MHLHGARAHKEPLHDCRVAHACSHEEQHLDLARRQSTGRAISCASEASGQALDPGKGFMYLITAVHW